MLSSRILARPSVNVSTRHLRRSSLVRPSSAISGSRRTFPVVQTAWASSFSGFSRHAFASPLSHFVLHQIDDDPTLSQQSIYHQQVRWKRKSGVSAHDPKPRRFSKKQKKRFRRNIERERELEKHGVPGYKAGPKREYLEELRKEMVDEYQARLDGSYEQEKLKGRNPLDDPALEYTANDAMFDDLIGNSGYTGQATPEPMYYGDRQQAFFNHVKHQLQIYHNEMKALGASASPQALKHLLPADRELSGAIKAYRDQRGTKQKPVGIAKALHHVLKEIQIPSVGLCFGEYSYNALLTCCRTPKEGLRVFQLMEEHNHPISKYSWAILMDIHAKVGDFEGCVRVLEEMTAAGHEPNLAAYTSLLAACYKVCNDGRVSHKIRAKAGEVGWQKWQEMQIEGVEPDVMAYGAILRLCAARGQGERCMNLLEEMPRFEVDPTTLCFSSALKAIAKSHETAIRYERGWSKHNRRRERITAHHGKMAFDVVLLAEAAKVELDDGFISALQLCAAAAGDSATAKAIYLASKVLRNMKHWRVIGGDDHLARLRGEDPLGIYDQQLESGGSQVAVANGDSPAAISNANIHKRQKQKRLSFGEREYGKDTRTLTAILRACAQASDTRGVGTMWSGRENYGYLDLTSLRLIQEYRKPSYRNTDVPGMSRTDFGISSMVEVDDLINPRKRTDPYLQGRARKKYPGMITMEGTPEGLHDLPEEDYKRFFHEDGMMRQEYIDSGEYPEYERYQENERRLAAKEAMLELRQSQQNTAERIEGGENTAERIEGGDHEATPMHFCHETRRWKMGDSEGQEVARSVATHSSRSVGSESMLNTVTAVESEEEVREVTTNDSSEDATKEEWYFDADARCWKTRMVKVDKATENNSEVALTDFEARAIEESRLKAEEHELDFDEEEDDDDDEMDEEEFSRILMVQAEKMGFDGDKFMHAEIENDFITFFDHLKNEMKENGEEETADEFEARQLFMVMRHQFEEELKSTGEADEEPIEDATEVEVDEQGKSDDTIPTLARGRTPPKQEFNEIMKELKDEWGEDGDEIDIDDWGDNDTDDEEEVAAPTQTLDRNLDLAPAETKATAWKSPEEFLEGLDSNDTLQDDSALSTQVAYPPMQTADIVPDALDDDFELQELRELLPGLPTSRLRKVRKAYEDNLTDPSLLTLVPILRETMPDWFTSKSLRATNAKNAHFVFAKAKEAGMLDVHVLNGMLQVYTSSGSIEHALALYEEYDELNLQPTSYSDRLVVQMFLKQRRFQRCLAFKQMAEERGRKLDIPAYGSLIQHCSKHGQLGSALKFLEECIRVNGAPPGEAYLKDLRIQCRKEEIEEEVGLESMIGEDPILWKKHGEAVLKPGPAGKRSHLNIAINATVRA